MNYANYIVTVEDFPIPGVSFKDITPLLERGKVFNSCILDMAMILSGHNIMFDKIFCAEARGFIFGAALAYHTGASLVLARKPGKLPRPGDSVTYGLEYGKAELQVSAGTFSSNDKVLIVDDVLATGGSAQAMASLVARAGASVVGFMFLADLVELGGEGRLTNRWDVPVFSLVRYGAVCGETVMFKGDYFVDDDDCRYNGTMEGIVLGKEGDNYRVGIHIENDGGRVLTVPPNIIHSVRAVHGVIRDFVI